jgi:hypothetical protein
LVAAEDQEPLRKAVSGLEQPSDAAVRLPFVEAAEGGADGPPKPAVVPVILATLETGAWAGKLGVAEHGHLHVSH